MSCKSIILSCSYQSRNQGQHEHGFCPAATSSMHLQHNA